MNLVPASKTGRCWNGAERDQGHVIHLVQPLPPQTNGDWFTKALCGAVPGRRSNGWSERQGPATCLKCITKHKIDSNG